MGVRDYNVDTDNSQFARKVVSLHCNEGASVAGVKVAGVNIPFAGTLLSAVLRCHVLTDADDSARVDLLKNGTSILSAAVDPGASDTTTTLSPTDTDIADGDLYEMKITTGVGDAIRASITLEVRPDLGSQELTSPLSNA